MCPCPHPSAPPPTHATDYPGSRVTPASLLTVQTLQRRSFGHRNLRTYVVVVADPRSAACRAVESPLESLASGLAHERGAAVLSLDASLPANAAFASRILGVGALPAVLVYPEAAPGFLAYRGAGLGRAGRHRHGAAAFLSVVRCHSSHTWCSPKQRAMECTAVCGTGRRCQLHCCRLHEKFF
jgi:hypothetical protein